MEPKIQAVRYDLNSTLTLLKSAALARAFAENTHTQYEPEMGNVVVNLMYNIMPWKERMGVNVVHQAPKRVIAAAAMQHYSSFVQKWLESVIFGGGQSAQPYLESIQRVRNLDMDNVQALFRETAEHNGEAFQMARNHILAMQGVVAVGTIAVAALGAYGALAIMAGGATIIPIGGSAGAVFGTGVASSAAMGLVKSWGKGIRAGVVGVGEELIPKAGDRGGEWVAETMFEKATADKDAAQAVYNKATRTIGHYSRQAAGTIRQRVQRRAAEKIMEAKVAQVGSQDAMKGAANLARTGRFVNKACPVVFALWESVGAVMEFKEVYDETGPGGGKE